MLLPLLISFALSTSASASASSSTPAQTPFAIPSTTPASTNLARPLKGRFIHLTDLHPDPFYKAGADEDEACHFDRKKKKHKKKKGKGKASSDGAEDDEYESELDDIDEVQALSKDGSRTAGYWGLPVSYVLSCPYAFVDSFLFFPRSSRFSRIKPVLAPY
jgi:endopolyphosphatase